MSRRRKLLAVFVFGLITCLSFVLYAQETFGLGPVVKEVRTVEVVELTFDLGPVKPVAVRKVTVRPVASRSVTRTFSSYRSVSAPQWRIIGVSMTRSNVLSHLVNDHGYSRADLASLSIGQLYALHDDDHNKKVSRTVTRSTPVAKRTATRTVTRSRRWLRGGFFAP